MPPRLSADVEAKIVELRESDPPKSYTEISRLTGVPPPEIANVLRRAGLTNPSRKVGAGPSTSSAPSPPVPVDDEPELEYTPPPATPPRTSPRARPPVATPPVDQSDDGARDGDQCSNCDGDVDRAERPAFCPHCDARLVW